MPNKLTRFEALLENVPPGKGTAVNADHLKEATCRCLQEQSNIGIFTTDCALTITSWNQWLELHSGTAAREIVGRHLLEAYPDLRMRHLEQYYQEALAGRNVVLSQRFHRYALPMPPTVQGHEKRPVPFMLQNVRVSPLIESELVIGTLTVIEDVSERTVRDWELEVHIAKLHESEQALQTSRDALAEQLRELERQNREITLLSETLKELSIRDPLTGLFNRRYMEEAMARELSRAQRAGRNIGIIMLDVDHFKEFNDRHGHQAGDALLATLAVFLQAGVRPGDIACRYGGEEFTLILPDAPAESVQQRAEEIRKKVKKLSVRHMGQNIGQMTLSLGVAIFPDHGATTAALIQSADEALYRAKAGGRDRVETAARE